MAEPEPQTETKIPDMPKVIEEPGKGGKAFRAFQKQDVNATTWESHVGSMLGSLAYLGIYTSGVLAIPAVAMVGIALGLSFGAGWIGQKIGSARVERENKEGKVYEQPTGMNRDAIEQGLSGMFLWKLLGMLGAGAVSLAIPGGEGFFPAAGTAAHSMVAAASWVAAGIGGIRGLSSGASQGKARMEREFQDAELINALQTGKGIPNRQLNVLGGPSLGPATGVATNIVSTVDPTSIIHSIPGGLGEKMPEAAGIAAGKKVHDFSYLGAAHPAATKPKISFSDRELAKAAAKELPQEVTFH